MNMIWRKTSLLNFPIFCSPIDLAREVEDQTSELEEPMFLELPEHAEFVEII